MDPSDPWRSSGHAGHLSNISVCQRWEADLQRITLCWAMFSEGATHTYRELLPLIQPGPTIRLIRSV